MIEEIVISGSDKRWWDYSELFNTTAAKWRMLCVFSMAFISQVCLQLLTLLRLDMRGDPPLESNSQFFLGGGLNFGCCI